MNLIKEAKLNRGKRIQSIKCGWSFEPLVCLLNEIYLETPFEYQCHYCKQTFLINDLEQYCENCFEGEIYPHTNEIKNKIYNFEVEIVEQKEKNYLDLDLSTLYKIKVNEFYGTMFCGMLEEPNEWSSTPHDDYWHITFLFIDSESCDEEYTTMKQLSAYLEN